MSRWLALSISMAVMACDAPTPPPPPTAPPSPIVAPPPPPPTPSKPAIDPKTAMEEILKGHANRGIDQPGHFPNQDPHDPNRIFEKKDGFDATSSAAPPEAPRSFETKEDKEQAKLFRQNHVKTLLGTEKNQRGVFVRFGHPPPPHRAAKLEEQSPDPVIGFDDPKNSIGWRVETAHKNQCPSTSVSREHKKNTPTSGTVRVSAPQTLAVLSPGLVRDACFMIRYASDSKDSALIQSIRVVSDGPLDIRLNKNMKSTSLPKTMAKELWDQDPVASIVWLYGTGGLVDVVQLSLAPLGLVEEQDPMVIPSGYGSYGYVHIAVPPGTPPGTYSGKLQVSGNFPTQTLDFSIEIKPFKEFFQKAMAALDAPISELPLGKLIAAAPDRQRYFDLTFDHAEQNRFPSGTWERWILCKDMILDVGNLQAVGPILRTNEGVQQIECRGPRSLPYFYVLRQKSIDIVDPLLRRTVGRIAAPSPDGFKAPMRFSPDGARLLVPDAFGRLWLCREKNGTWSKPSLLTDFSVLNYAVDEKLEWLAAARPYNAPGGKGLMVFELTTGQSREVKTPVAPAYKIAIHSAQDVLAVEHIGEFPTRIAVHQLTDGRLIEDVKSEFDACKEWYLDNQGRVILVGFDGEWESYAPSTKWRQKNGRDVDPPSIPGPPAYVVPGTSYRCTMTMSGRVRLHR